jgi:acyl-CoA reductase-like NAD-dependent aldehyde dehydrogenase
MAAPTETTVTRSVDPRTGTAFGPEYRDATPAEVAAAVDAAADAFLVTRHAAPTTIAGLLDAIADGLEALGGKLIDTAVAETGLDATRVTGERGRTCGQLRAFAEVARSGTHLDIRIDPADPDSVPPRPDLRRLQVPIGPVAVWGASNFPLAFSVPGGDTASALAAGCPVVAKAHPSHPATSELCAEVITAAVAEAGLPAGTFTLLHGRDPSVSRALVTAPGIAAAGFTGSETAGRALYDLAAARPHPIPVFAEMGSLNPQFVTEAAIAERGQDLAAGLVASFTLGTGQFCTKPGLVFLPDSAGGRELEAAVTAAAAEVAPTPLLGAGIGTGLRARLGELAGLAGVEVVLADRSSDAGAWAGPTVLVTDADTLARTPMLREECFGPATVLVRVASPEGMVALVPGLPGSLTASIHAAASDVDHLDDLVGSLQHKVGRVVWNQFPTGVAVTHAMHHAGPYPASTFVQHTSVGSAAIARFVRPVTFQNAPQALLPEPLRDENPHQRWRLVDGQLTREAIS